MLTERQSLIFKHIVDEFVSTAEPVSSKMLIDKYNINYSSATVRNEMAELERLGLIEKTHISSGRIPSINGYSYYVEFLMEKVDSTQYEVALRSLVEHSYMNAEEAIKSARDVISQMTNLTSIVLGPSASEQRLMHIKLFSMDDKSAVAVFVTDSGHTENKVFRFTDSLSLADISATTEILNDRLTGTPIKDVLVKLETLKPILEEAVGRHEVIYNAFLSAFSQLSNDGMYFSGEANMYNQPDFVDLDRIRQLMLMIGNRQVWNDISEGHADVLLETSEKSQLAWIDDIAVVSTSLRISDSQSAKLMLVGPSRMDYERAISLIEVLKDSLETLYIEASNDGGKNEE